MSMHDHAHHEGQPQGSFLNVEEALRTPEKRAILKSLPPDKLVKRTKDGNLYYVYADAARCNCGYVGTPQAYAAYQNWGNDPNFGGGDQQSNAMQTIDSDVGAPYNPVRQPCS